MVDLSDAVVAEYTAIRQHAGWADGCSRTRLEITGSDRAVFLHNFCTNDIKALRPGGIGEVFFTNVQGKIVGFAQVLARDCSLLIETVPNQVERLLAHLDRYLIREDAQLVDRSEWDEVLVVGPQAASTLAALGGDLEPPPSNALVEVDVEGRPVVIGHVDYFDSETYLVLGPEASLDPVRQHLRQSEVVECGGEALEMCRIEQGTPYYGSDITDKNLPQEVQRNERAISFTKGCYLGQETVARIDALGHVNRLLVQLKFEAAGIPQPGLALRANDKQIGEVTSAAYSLKYSAPLGLGYVRREHHEVGTRLDSEVGPAEIL